MRVLVVDNSRRLADVVAESLEDHGMAVDVAYTGEEALRKLGLNTYQVVVLDRQLPDQYGEALCRQIVEVSDRSMVLLMSTSGAPEDRVAGLRLGADDYLVKPFHFPELVLRIRALARRQPAAQPCIFRASGIELDTVRHVASREGLPLDLSAKEFGVLEVLMRSDHAFVSAEELLEQAWDEHAYPFTNAVAVTISRLRRKLGEPAVIETVPHRGYRLTKQPGSCTNRASFAS
jgi:DNA-binding response OmpR family regulator